MKKQSQILAAFIVIVFCVFGSSGKLYSQPPQGRRPPMLPDSIHIVQRVNELANTLSLSDQQKAGILKLHFEHFGQIKQMMLKEKEHQEKMRSAHDQLKEQFEASILRLLTDEQKTKFEEFSKTHRPHHPEGNHNPDHMEPGLRTPKKGAPNENQE